MIRYILLILLISITSLTSNDLFFHHKSGNVELTELINNKLVVLPLEFGRTYTLTNNLSIVTGTNSNMYSEAHYIFPHRIAISQKESSSTYFNETPIEYYNDFKLPEVLRVKNSSLNFTLNGTLYCVSESTNQTIISTSLCFLSFKQSQFFVKSSDKYTHVYVIDGNVVVNDNKSKKKKELKKGDYLVITPQVFVSPKESNNIKPGNSFSTKEIEEDENMVHLGEIEQLKIKLKYTLFVNYGHSIFGFETSPNDYFPITISE